MTPEELRTIIEEEFKVDISSKYRKREIVDLRQLYCYMAYYLFPTYRLDAIGSVVCVKHDVVLYSVNNFKESISFDKRLKMKFNVIDKKISFSEHVESIYADLKQDNLISLKRKLKSARHRADKYRYQLDGLKIRYRTLEKKWNKLRTKARELSLV